MSVQQLGEEMVVWSNTESCPPESLLANSALQDQSTWSETLKLHVKECDVCSENLKFLQGAGAAEETLSQFFARIRFTAPLQERRQSFYWGRALLAYVSMPEMRMGVSISLLILALFAGVWFLGAREAAITNGSFKESQPVTLSFGQDEFQPLRDFYVLASTEQPLSQEQLTQFNELKQKAAALSAEQLSGSQNAELNTLIVGIDARVIQQNIKTDSALFSAPLMALNQSMPSDRRIMACLWEDIGASRQVLVEWKKTVATAQATPEPDLDLLRAKFAKITDTRDEQLRANTIVLGMNFVKVISREPGSESILCEINSSMRTLKEYQIMDIGLDSFRRRSGVKVLLKTPEGNKELISFSQSVTLAAAAQPSGSP